MNITGAVSKSLEEIPLAEGGPKGNGDEKEDSAKARENMHEIESRQDLGEKERKLKISCLKKFLHLPSKKSLDKAKEHELDVVTPTDEKVDNNDGEEKASGSKTNKKSNKHSQLPLGGMFRHASLPRYKSKYDLNSRSSKITLKSSFSGFWNSVFKKERKSQSEYDIEETEGDVKFTNFLETKSECRTLREDIHSLKISEDPN
uniref:Uncharacterized protein n=1 Tax=Stomoxys calcitrans TaxID=35570 RepID=A0A1I8PKS6_STOCA